MTDYQYKTKINDKRTISFSVKLCWSNSKLTEQLCTCIILLSKYVHSHELGIRQPAGTLQTNAYFTFNIRYYYPVCISDLSLHVIYHLRHCMSSSMYYIHFLKASLNNFPSYLWHFCSHIHVLHIHLLISHTCSHKCMKCYSPVIKCNQTIVNYTGKRIMHWSTTLPWSISIV